MPASSNSGPTAPVPRSLEERLSLAKELYRAYHTRCFWHCPPELEITEDLIPFIVKGLRTHGGRRGFILASRLKPEAVPPAAREPRECR
jgi:hypothetical protein